jgi:hypothetical protein
MEHPYFPSHFIPDRMGGVMMLLEWVDFDLEKLSPAQVARIRQLLFLDDLRTCRELYEQGLIRI